MIELEETFIDILKKNLLREDLKMIRTFYLHRKKDVSGVSGTGFVAQGVVFQSGSVVIEWTVLPHTIAIHDSIDSLLQVHGHGGNTVIVWTEELSNFVMTEQ